MSIVRLAEQLPQLDDGTLLLTPAEAANELRVSASKVYHLLTERGEGAIPRVHIGSSVRIPREQLREWIRSKIHDEGTA